MPEKKSIEEFLPLTDTWPLVDVRSPAEFAQGHIPGAVNIPLFDNEERAAVGIRYKQGGNENAVMLGLEIVGPKLAHLAWEAKKTAKKKRLLVHCWRGGMRSESMAWLFETAGLQVTLLEGGYKAYRRYIREQFSKPVKLIILSGLTGSGKTDILKHLAKSGEQFLDIEGLAHHKGSAFGHLGMEEQPTNEQFENNLADAWRKFDSNSMIWTEDESRVLGRCSVPDPLYKQVREGNVIRIRVPEPEREKRLVREYGQFEKSVLLETLRKIEKRMGGLAVKQAAEALDNGDLLKVAEITLHYYDKTYSHGNAERKTTSLFELDVPYDDPEKTAAMLKEFATRHF